MADIVWHGTDGEDNIQDANWREGDHVTSNMGEGGDTFVGWGASYTVNGEGGDDRIYAGSRGGTAHGGEGHDWLIAQAINPGYVHTLYGDDGDDYFLSWGTSNVGTIQSYGGDGVDYFQDSHTGGTDVFDGGADFDWVVNAGSVGVVLSLASGGSAGVATGTSYISIEGFLGTIYGDSITGDSAHNVLSGAGGADTLDGAGGNDLLVGRSMNFELFTGTRNQAPFAVNAYSYFDSNALLPENGDDDGSADMLSGGIGDDVLMGGYGADTLNGGADNDTALYRESTQGVTVNLTTGTGLGGSAEGDVLIGIENLYGSGASDRLTGNAQVNSLVGQEGNDTLDGAGGADTMSGGGGDDTYYVDNANDIILESWGSDTVYAAGANYALAGGLEIELFAVTNAASTNAQNLSGNQFAQALNGNNGNNGNNVLNGGMGADTMSGYLGNDTYFVDNVGDVVIDTGGTDAIVSLINYTLAGGLAIETLSVYQITSTNAVNLTGNEFGQRLNGNNGANVLNGAGGGDQMFGFGGDDTYFVDNIYDTVVETAGQGNDTVYANRSYTLTTGQSVEVLATSPQSATTAINLTGNDVGQRVSGNNGANLLDGAGGNDVLSGFSGNDTLIGGAGADTIDSGNGNDIVRVLTAAESTGTGRDMLVAMSFDADKLDLGVTVTNIGTMVTTGQLSAATFDAQIAAAVNASLNPNGAVLFDPSAGDLNIYGRMFLVVDANGDGNYSAGTDYVFELVTPTGTLTLDDFV